MGDHCAGVRGGYHGRRGAGQPADCRRASLYYGTRRRESQPQEVQEEDRSAAVLHAAVSDQREHQAGAGLHRQAGQPRHRLAALAQAHDCRASQEALLGGLQYGLEQHPLPLAWTRVIFARAVRRLWLPSEHQRLLHAQGWGGLRTPQRLDGRLRVPAAGIQDVDTVSAPDRPFHPAGTAARRRVPRHAALPRADGAPLRQRPRAVHRGDARAAPGRRYVHPARDGTQRIGGNRRGELAAHLGGRRSGPHVHVPGLAASTTGGVGAGGTPLLGGRGG